MNCGIISLKSQYEYSFSLLKYILKQIGILNFTEPKLINDFYFCNDKIKKVITENDIFKICLRTKLLYYSYYTDKTNEQSLQLILNFDKLTLKQMNKIRNEYIDFFELKIIKNNSKEMKTSIVEKKKRTSVEYNGTELALALLIINPEIICHESLVQKANELKEKFQSETESYGSMNNIKLWGMLDLDGYLQDIMKIEKKIIYNKFISNYHSCISTSSGFNFTRKDIDSIFISGKKNKHQEISELNNQLNKLQTKSDIYVKLNNGNFVGISVKQSTNATKSNYSVQKMLGKENDKLLTNIRKHYLLSYGFEKMDKSKRAEMNKIFYKSSSPNPYWDKLRELINENKSHIIEQLVSALYCVNASYDIYEFNGTKIMKLNGLEKNNTNITFDEYDPYYYDSFGNQRQTAKLFYRLDVSSCIYRVEIRWKGNIYNSSPQFQIHETD